MSPWGRSTGREDAGSPLVCSVSTVKNSTANVIEFVDRNLAAGIDHMFLFLEGSPDEVKVTSASLRDHTDHATPIRVGPRYWNHRRPPGLNHRQVANAGFINCVLAPFPDVEWLFHIDGDECVDIDREHLLAVHPDVPCVRLQTREAVSQMHWDSDVNLFKRQLDHEDLCLLTILGTISSPANTRYFNGHVAGKPGLRPNLDLRPRIHKVLDFDGQEIEPFESDELHVLHYESYSGEEFVRKWLAHLTSGTTSTFSAYKDQLRAAIVGVLRNPVLTENQKRELLHELYRRRVEDDLPQLQRLGLLVTPDPSQHQHSPRSFSPEDARAVGQLINRLRRADKRHFTYGQEGPEPAELLRNVRSHLGPEHAHLSSRLDNLLERRSGAEPSFQRSPALPGVTATDTSM